jgi:hypothetical protein
VFSRLSGSSPFLSGDLDFTLLNQSRNSIPDELLELV